MNAWLRIALLVPAWRLMKDDQATSPARQAARWSVTGVAGFLVLSMLAYPALRPMERMLFQLHAAILIVVIYLVEEVFARAIYTTPDWLWVAPIAILLPR